MATIAEANKRPRTDSEPEADGSPVKRAKASQPSEAEQLLSVGPIGEHIYTSTLLPALHQLLSVYKVEYWALLEELRAKRHAYCEAGRASSEAADPASSQAVAAAIAASEGSMRQLIQAMRPSQGQAAAGADVVIVAEHDKGPSATQQHEQQHTRQDAEAGDATAEQQPQQQHTQPARYGDERCGYGRRADEGSRQPAPAEAQQVLLQLPLGSDKGPASLEQLQSWHERFMGSAAAVAALEQLASAATLQYMDAQGGLACLCGTAGRWVLRRTAVSLGRSSDSKGDVDVDLGKAPTAAGAAGGAAAGAAGGRSSVSRLQAQLCLGLDGSWSIRNTGRAALAVNGSKVSRGVQVALPHLSLLEVGGEPLLFMVNGMAVQRAVARSTHLVM